MCLRWMSLLFTNEVSSDENLYDLWRLVFILGCFI
jgi:hypothetical protein